MSESGIDNARGYPAARCGWRAGFLIGESLLRGGKPREALGALTRALDEVGRCERPNERAGENLRRHDAIEDAKLAIACGADLIGLNFYPPSPRYARSRTRVQDS